MLTSGKENTCMSGFGKNCLDSGMYTLWTLDMLECRLNLIHKKSLKLAMNFWTAVLVIYSS